MEPAGHQIVSAANCLRFIPLCFQDRYLWLSSWYHALLLLLLLMNFISVRGKYML